MKSIIHFNKAVIVLLGTTIILSSCSTWHYNHPRVKTEGQPLVMGQGQPISDAVSDENTTTSGILLADDQNISDDANSDEEITSQDVASTNKNEGIYSVKKNFKSMPSQNHKLIVKNKHHQELFTKKISSGKTLFKVKEVENTSVLTGWLRWMILLFAIGIILILVGAFLYVFIFGPLWWLFYFFGAMFLLAGFVVLILGVLGELI